ncbi:MAG: PPC domain-containing protein [Rubripirellula sp.]
MLSLVAIATIFAEPICAQFHVCELRSLSRTGGQQGTDFDLDVVAGDRLNEANDLVFSNPGITAVQRTTAVLPFSDSPVGLSGKFRVSVDAAVPPGAYEVRVSGRHGLSNPRIFIVTSAVNQLVSAVSHDPQVPTELPTGQFVNASCTAEQRDWFRFELSEAADVRVSLLAGRVDSRMIGQVKVLDSNGRSVAVARGSDEFDPTIRLAKLPAGNYAIMVHDFLYRGGSEYPYQLVVAVGADEPESEASLFGLGSGLVEKAAGRLPANLTPSAITLGPGTVSLSDAAQPSAIQKVAMPSKGSWWFPVDQSAQVFQFGAKKGEQISVEVVSDRVGQPSDARLFVQRIEPQQDAEPKYHSVAQADDSFKLGSEPLSLVTKDPVVSWTSTHDADYRVLVHDMDVGQMLSKRQAFQLSIGKPVPRFNLVAFAAFPNKDVKQYRGFGSKLFRGGTEAIHVIAARRDGWVGPIKVTLEGLPSGVTATEVVMAANQHEAQITLEASEDAKATNFTVVVVGSSDDGETRVAATPMTQIWGRGAGRDFVRSRVSTDLSFHVSDRDLAPVTIRISDGKVAQIKKTEALSVPVAITRRNGGAEACVLRARNLPPGVTIADVTVAKDKNEGELKVSVSDKALPGTYSLWMQVETKLKVKPNTQALERAQVYRKHLQTLHDDPAQTAQLEAIKAAIVAADKKVEAAKAEAKEQQLTVYIPSPNLTIQVVDP